MYKYFFFLLILAVPCTGSGYFFWMKSFDNSVEHILQIEEQYQVYLPLVSFIYDPWRAQDVLWELDKIKKLLGEERVYHISLSPDSFSAEEVVNGAFDAEYLAFFQQIKKLNLRIVFRTMHEMNGGWYPWSSHPENFKKAWKHVWDLSRSVGLSQENILFDFSVNAWDLPAKWGRPSQTSVFIHCMPKEKKKLKCPSFEDYYPGDAYVDLVWFTFYNWGKGNSDRWWGSPDRIVNNASRNTLARVKKFGKPLFVDEVGTSSVEYAGPYSYQKSLEFYDTRSDLKNAWLLQLRDFLLREESIVWAIYFNVDLTDGLRKRIIGELDWALINPSMGKFYEGFWDLYHGANFDLAPLLRLFGVEKVDINGKKKYLSPFVAKRVVEIEAIVQEKYPDIAEKAEFYQKFSGFTTNQESFNRAFATLLELYSLESSASGDSQASLEEWINPYEASRWIVPSDYY